LDRFYCFVNMYVEYVFLETKKKERERGRDTERTINSVGIVNHHGSNKVRTRGGGWEETGISFNMSVLIDLYQKIAVTRSKAVGQGHLKTLFSSFCFFKTPPTHTHKHQKARKETIEED